MPSKSSLEEDIRVRVTKETKARLEALLALRPAGASLSDIIREAVEFFLASLASPSSGDVNVVPFPVTENKPLRTADFYESIAAGVTTGIAADDGAVKVRLPLTWEHPTDFIVKVYGDSMCGMVEDGELAAFIRDAEPGVGDIVAAVVDGQTMLKMLAMDGLRKVLVSLHPDRKKYPPIKVTKNTIYRGKFIKKYDGPIDRIETHG